jgi:serine/threonine protein kinase
MFAQTPEDQLAGEPKKVLNQPSMLEDATGYYTPQQDEILYEKYKVIGFCGKGIFSNVVKVVDINNKKEYAVKIIRAIDVMLISGEKERSILKKLNEVDKYGK